MRRQHLQGINCYFDSQFLLRPNAQNLLDCLVQSINSLSVENFIQLSINGPTANWAVLNKKKRDQLPPVEDKGSCSLLIVSGNFRVELEQQAGILTRS